MWVENQVTSQSLAPLPSIDVQRRWVQAINATGCGLTDWERQFMADVTRTVCSYGLSRPQVKILEKIYAEKTP